MKSFFVLPGLLLVAVLANCSPPSSNRCVPNMVISCPCAGGGSGIQMCAADGTYGQCVCAAPQDAGPTDTGTDAQTDTGTDVATDSPVDVGVDVPADVPSDVPVDTGPPAPTYVGMVPNAPPVWSGLGSAGGMTSIDAGNAACTAQIGSTSHACEYQEVLLAQSRGELASIPVGTTAWLQRSTNATVGGMTYLPGPGANCNNWTYATNHIGDGEYITFDTTGMPTYHLDSDAVFDPAAPGAHTSADLQCGGVMRSILCCH